MTDTCPECGQSRKASAMALQYMKTSEYWVERAQLMEAERDQARNDLQRLIDSENVLVDEAAEYDRLARVAKASRDKWKARALELGERVARLEGALSGYRASHDYMTAEYEGKSYPTKRDCLCDLCNSARAALKVSDGTV